MGIIEEKMEATIMDHIKVKGVYWGDMGLYRDNGKKMEATGIIGIISVLFTAGFAHRWLCCLAGGPRKTLLSASQSFDATLNPKPTM